MAPRATRGSSPEGAVEVLERGHVYFFYRPKVDAQVARGPDDVQRLYMILRPRGKRTYRIIVIPEKRLPDLTAEGDRKTWGFVETVASRPADVEDELDPERYRTKTRGERELPAARPAGEGVYAIVRHGDHTHLAYKLELPDQDVSRELGLELSPEHETVATAEIVRDLRLERSMHPLAPLVSGRWE